MTALPALWLPILLSSVIVFIVSAIVHSLPLLWHHNDYPAPPDADRLLAAMRPFSLPPGDYMAPRAGSMAAAKSPEFQEKLTNGPVVIMTVVPPGPITMARPLGLWFIYVAIVNYFAAYIASRALPPGAHYLEVFRFAGATAFIGYTVALWQMSIWYRRSWSLTIKYTIDGLIYSLLVAGTFGWLWPR